MNTARLTMANDPPTSQVMLTLREEVADEYALLLRTLEQLGCRHSLDSLTEGRYPITVCCSPCVNGFVMRCRCAVEDCDPRSTHSRTIVWSAALFSHSPVASFLRAGLAPRLCSGVDLLHIDARESAGGDAAEMVHQLCEEAMELVRLLPAHLVSPSRAAQELLLLRCAGLPDDPACCVIRCADKQI